MPSSLEAGPVRETDELLGVGGSENCDYCWAGHMQRPVNHCGVERCGFCGYTRRYVRS